MKNGSLNVDTGFINLINARDNKPVTFNELLNVIRQVEPDVSFDDLMAVIDLIDDDMIIEAQHADAMQYANIRVKL